MTAIVIIFGLIIIALLVYILYDNRKRGSASSFHSSTPSSYTAQQSSTSNLTPKDRIPKTAAEICIFYNEMRLSASCIMSYTADELLYLLPFVYLYPAIKANVYGRDWKDVIAYSVYAAHKEAEDTDTTVFSCVVYRTIFLQEMQGMNNDIHSEMVINAIMHYQQDILDITSIYDVESRRVYEASIELGTDLEFASKLLARDFEYIEKKEYRLLEYREIANKVISQLATSEEAKAYLSYVKTHMNDFENYC